MMGTKSIPAFVIAGTHSGAGKTTVTLGLMELLKRMGMKVQPFKVGPDYIDPGHHTALTGRCSRNLDVFLMDEEGVRASFANACAGADVAVIEGVMGLYDGKLGQGTWGSTAHIAKLLGCPVLLVIDAASASTSAGAVALGFRMYDRAVSIMGTFANRMGSEIQLQTVAEAVGNAGMPLLGSLPRNQAQKGNERHLGLRTAMEADSLWEQAGAVADMMENSTDIGRILSSAGRVAAADPEERTPSAPNKVVIAYAWDEAFCFYYKDSLDAFERQGAVMVPFSPLKDADLPQGISGIYLGGGYPELYGRELENNKAMRNSVRAAVENGMPVVAECGGMMYLCREVTDMSGETWEGCGVLAARCRMTNKLQGLGYATLGIPCDSPVGPSGTCLPVHLFHYSVLRTETGPNVTITKGSRVWDEGFAAPSLLASYGHLHFGGSPNAARCFINACRAWRRRVGP